MGVSGEEFFPSKGKNDNKIKNKNDNEVRKINKVKSEQKQLNKSRTCSLPLEGFSMLELMKPSKL